MEKIHTDVRVQRVKTYCWGEGMCHCISTGPSPLHWMWSIFIPYRRLRKCRCCWNTEGINIRGGLKCILLIGRDELKLVNTIIILSKSREQSRDFLPLIGQEDQLKFFNRDFFFFKIPWKCLHDKSCQCHFRQIWLVSDFRWFRSWFRCYYFVWLCNQVS